MKRHAFFSSLAGLAMLTLLTVPVTADPLPPIDILQPQAGANQPSSAAVTFQWDAVAGATSYQLSVCLQSGCDGGGLLLQETLTGTAHSEFFDPGSYILFVEAYQDTTLTALSETRSFWVDDFCANQLLTGDFDGDGRTDRMCSGGGTTRVSLATATGFLPPEEWLAESFTHPMVGDFTGDGRSDVADYDSSTGEFSIAVSTGASLSPPTSWGMAEVTDPTGGTTTDYTADLFPTAVASNSNYYGYGADIVSAVRTYDGDASYAHTGHVNAHLRYYFDHIPSTATVNSVGFRLRGRAYQWEPPGMAQYRFIYPPGGSHFEGSEYLAVSSSYVEYQGPTHTMNPVTGAPWTAEEVNSMSAGVTTYASGALPKYTRMSLRVQYSITEGMNHVCASTSAHIGAGDFNGDGRTDVSCRSAVGEEVLVGLSDGTGFVYSVFGTPTCDSSEKTGTLDFDGNGRDDWYCLGLTNGLFRVFPSTGETFLEGVTAADASFCTVDHYVIGDFNGDGRTDLSCTSNGKVTLSTGSAYLYQGEYGNWCTNSTNAFAADVDGDGVSELVCNSEGAGSDDILVREWQITGLGTEETWLGGFCAGTVTSGDFNGDGKSDLLCDAVDAAIAGTAAVKADLMVAAQGSLGGSVDVVYTPSTEFDNEPGLSPKYVVTELTANDGQGRISTTTHQYSGGRMDQEERRFLGFGYMRQTLPCLQNETACPYVETWLRQDLAAAGSPERVERHAGDGTLLQATDYAYATTETPLPRKALLAEVTSYSYDGSGAGCPSWPCANGKRTRVSYEYDSYGNKTQSVSHGDFDELGDETTTTWSYVPNTAAYIVDRVATTRTYAGEGTGGALLAETLVLYDGAAGSGQAPTKGHPTGTSRWRDSHGDYVTSYVGYDAAGNPYSMSDETGRTATIVYDTAGLFPETITDPAGLSEILTWDTLCGTPTQRIDANDQTWTFQSDALCRPIRTDGPLGVFQQSSYLDLGDPFQQRVRVETPSPSSGDGTGHHWTLTFMDGLGRTYRTMTKGPSTSQRILVDVDFDARGNISRQTAPYYEGDPVQVTSYAYDALDRRVLTTLPDDTELPAGYGLWSSYSMDPHGHEAWRFSDAHGRVVAEERYLGGDAVVTSYVYDLLGRLVSMQDAAGNSWSWEYDSLGRLLEKNDPDAGTWGFTYDDAGRLLTQTDAKSQLTEIGYDTGGRLETKTIGGQTTTFVYGEARGGFFNEGALTSVVSPVDALRYDYDELGRVVKETRSFEGQDYVLERRYDASGYLRGVTYPDGDQIGTPSEPLVYDAAGRLTAIPWFVSEVAYDALGRPTQISNLNGTTTTKTYSPERGWLTGIETTGPSTIQQLGYGYDSQGGGLLDLVTSPVTGEAWSYSYDDLHRLTTATNISSPLDSQSFSYDLVGNMTFNSRIGTYEYPPAGSVRPHGPAFVAGSPLSYDANGNLLAGQGRTMTWNAENLPSQITASGGSASFVYGGLGDRLKKAGSIATSITPFGDDYEITDGVVTKYVSVPGLGAIAKRVGTGPSAQSFWLHTDHLGSIQAITDVSASEVYRRSYRPYGETIAAVGSHAESRGWIDQRQDPETGLTYLHARYYDPNLGVFLSPDPLNPVASGVGPNRYAYGFGNPVRGSDRSGLEWVPCPTPEDPGRVCWHEYVEVVEGRTLPPLPLVLNGLGLATWAHRSQIPTLAQRQAGLQQLIDQFELSNLLGQLPQDVPAETDPVGGQPPAGQPPGGQPPGGGGGTPRESKDVASADSQAGEIGAAAAVGRPPGSRLAPSQKPPTVGQRFPRATPPQNPRPSGPVPGWANWELLKKDPMLELLARLLAPFRQGPTFVPLLIIVPVDCRHVTCPVFGEQPIT